VSGATGKTLRLGRLLGVPRRPAVCLALDHAMMLGPIAGLEDPRTTLAAAIAAGIDAVILTPGLLVRHADLLAGPGKPVVILRLDQTTMWRRGGRFGYDEGHTRLVTSVEEAVQLGADAVITYLFTCHRSPELETRSIEIAAAAARDARRFGLVWIAEPMAARGGMVEDVADPEVVAMNNRIAMELGADVLKTDWTGDARTFADVVATAGAPVLVAGGARAGGDEAVIEMVEQIAASGAAGILFGRNIIQSPDPGRLVRELRNAFDRRHGARGRTGTS